MWSLNLDRLLPLVPGGLGSLAIESGTCRGNGTRVLAKAFPKVISIELSEGLFRAARERFRSPDFAHVKLVNGNSAAELVRILPMLPPNEKIFFFLDAHWSGDSSVNWEESDWKGYGLDTAHLAPPGNLRPSGPEQCPLLEELKAITHHARGPALVLIDDMKNIPDVGPGLKNVGFAGEDWSHISRELILATVKMRLGAVHCLKDPEQWLFELKPN